MRHILACMALAAVASPATAVAQEPSLIDRVRGAMQLPAIVDSIRHRGGVPEGDLLAVIADHRRKRIPASETQATLEAADAAIKEHGPVDNFGAFVQSKLDAGLRGRELAQAIRQEHARRGIGKGKSRDAMARGPADSVSRARGKATTESKQPANPGSKASDTGDTRSKGKGKGRP